MKAKNLNWQLKKIKLTTDSFIVSVCSTGFDLGWLTNTTQLLSLSLLNRMGAGMTWKSSQVKTKTDGPLSSYHHSQNRLGENYLNLLPIKNKAG